jgi:ribosome-binding protein aMBF1 (putative translation factor)
MTPKRKRIYVDQWGRLLSDEEVSSALGREPSKDEYVPPAGDLRKGYCRSNKEETEKQRSIARGKLIRRWREKLLWTQEEVAKKLEVRIDDLIDFEAGNLAKLPGWEFEDIEFYFRAHLHKKYDF